MLDFFTGDFGVGEGSLF